MKYVLMVLVAFMFFGCANNKPQPQLIKNGATNSEKYNDIAYCESEKMKIQIADYEYRGTFMEGANIKSKQDKMYRLCLQGKGWTIK